MALERKYQKIFGKNADGADLSVVGSKSEDNPQYSTDVETIQSLSNWETGMRAIVTSSSAPYLQDQNSLFYVITSQLAYLFQAGVAEWNSQTEYFASRSAVFKNGRIYIAKANSTNVEPEVTEGWKGYWVDLLSIGTENFYLINSSVGAVRETIRLDLSNNGRFRINGATGVSFLNENNNSIGSIDVSGTASGNNSAVDFQFNSFTINGNPIIRLPNYKSRTVLASDDNSDPHELTMSNDGWLLLKTIGYPNGYVNVEDYTITGNGEATSFMIPIKSGDKVRVRRAIVWFYPYR